eukprot:6813075-Pyramimonas_sp.AAC.1
MTRHLYDPLRKERESAAPPKWLKQLREGQSASPSPSPIAARGARSRTKSASPSSKSSQQYVITYDAAQRAAHRAKLGSKASEPTRKLFAIDEANLSGFMHAEWPDGFVAELPTLTVAGWLSQNAAGESGSSGAKRAASAEDKLYKCFQGSSKIGKVKVECKGLSSTKGGSVEYGLVIKLNKAQKLQLAFKHVDELTAA